MRAVLLGILSVGAIIGGALGLLLIGAAFLICWPIPIGVFLFYWFFIRWQCRRHRVSVGRLRSYGSPPRYPKVHPSVDHGDLTPSAMDNPTWL